MSGPFDDDKKQRTEWWNERFWLQATLIFFFVLVVAATFYGVSILTIAGAAAFTVLSYGLGRLLHERT